MQQWMGVVVREGHVICVIMTHFIQKSICDSSLKITEIYSESSVDTLAEFAINLNGSSWIVKAKSRIVQGQFNRLYLKYGFCHFQYDCPAQDRDPVKHPHAEVLMDDNLFEEKKGCSNVSFELVLFWSYVNFFLEKRLQKFFQINLIQIRLKGKSCKDFFSVQTLE